jgi:hypothetical protein
LLPEVAGRPEAFQSYIAQCKVLLQGWALEQRIAWTKIRQLSQELTNVKFCPYSKRNYITIS